MKKIIILLPLTLLSCFFVGCDVVSPMDKDLYPQTVSIVGAPDKIIDRDLNIGHLPDTISISVSVSGSRPSSQNVMVTLGEDKDAIATYNVKNLSALITQYRQLAAGLYTYPYTNLTINAGQNYATFPIYITPTTFHCDSLYMIPLKLTSTSAFALNKVDTVALVRINMVNNYSGLYTMLGMIRNTTNVADSLVYKMSRNLKATDNGQTVRMYHYKNEFVQGDILDYRPSNGLKITVKADNTLSIVTWKNFPIIAGGGVYHPDLKLYDLWYTFTENGVIKKVTGYMYKVTKTIAQQRVIDDWIEVHPVGK
jgi:hypothetical protein